MKIFIKAIFMYVHRARGPGKVVQMASWPRRRVTLLLLLLGYVLALKLRKGFSQRHEELEEVQTWRRQEDNLWSTGNENKLPGMELKPLQAPTPPPPPRSPPPPSPQVSLSDTKKDLARKIKLPSPPLPSSPKYPPPAPRRQVGKKDNASTVVAPKNTTALGNNMETPFGDIDKSSCKIFVWDLANDLAPSIGMPRCNLTDIWPFDHHGTGIEGMRRTAHQDAPHATGYWLVDAVKKSRYHETSIDKADLILVDTHCYESMYYVAQHAMSRDEDRLDPVNELSLDISRLFVEGVTSSLQFTRSKGKKFVLIRPSLGAPPGVMLDTCAKFKSSFFVASERGIFCDNDRDRAFFGNSIILPPVTHGYLTEANVPELPSVEKRSILFFLRIPCFKDPTKDSGQGDVSPNIMLLQAIEKNIFVEILANREDVSIVSRKESCKASPSERASSIRKMRSSRYCGILPAADRQSTIELPLAIQSGCIPVFLGPPFHSMQMVPDLDYSKMAVFVNLVDHTKSMWKINELKMQDGDLEPDERINKEPVEVPYLLDAIRHLQNIPSSIAGELHEQVVRQIDSFSYRPSSTGGRNAQDIAIQSMIRYSMHLKQENERKARLRMPPPPQIKHT